MKAKHKKRTFRSNICSLYFFYTQLIFPLSFVVPKKSLFVFLPWNPLNNWHALIFCQPFPAGKVQGAFVLAFSIPKIVAAAEEAKKVIWNSNNVLRSVSAQVLHAMKRVWDSSKMCRALHKVSYCRQSLYLDPRFSICILHTNTTSWHVNFPLIKSHFHNESIILNFVLVFRFFENITEAFLGTLS